MAKIKIIRIKNKINKKKKIKVKVKDNKKIMKSNKISNNKRNISIHKMIQLLYNTQKVLKSVFHLQFKIIYLQYIKYGDFIDT
jgi:hypothetical protein